MTETDRAISMGLQPVASADELVTSILKTLQDKNSELRYEFTRDGRNEERLLQDANKYGTDTINQLIDAGKIIVDNDAVSITLLDAPVEVLAFLPLSSRVQVPEVSRWDLIDGVAHERIGVVDYKGRPTEAISGHVLNCGITCDITFKEHAKYVSIDIEVPK